MDYEKKYNEALNWMRELYPGLHGATKEDAEHYFPELRESEDERIRKWLVDYFSSIKETVWIHRDISCEQILAWLEKQKEHSMSAEEVLARAGLKPYKDGNQWCILAGDNIQEGICGFGDTIEDALCEFLKEVLDLQKEQKHAWSEEDEKILNELLDHCNTENATWYNWLKSLRPSWKPSEEQMDVLNKMTLGNFLGSGQYDILRTLYEQLKKL